MRDYKIYLKDILTAIDSIEEFTAEMDFEAFKADDKTTSAVIRNEEGITVFKNWPRSIFCFPFKGIGICILA
jgi:hypothetical protein